MIPYIGGKSQLANWVISNFPKDYKSFPYTEVFGGGGWVLFRKEESVLETYNDLNKSLVNLFRIIRDNFPEFSHRANWTLHSREMYSEAKQKLQDDKFLSEIEEAMYYATLQVQSFSGKGSSWGYQRAADKITSGQWLPFIKRLELINSRLKRVQIESLDFERVIAKYDTTNTLFYVDPPYVDAEYYYNVNDVNFTREDHYRLANILKDVQGKFLLSYYDNKLVRELYKGYRILTKKTVKSSRGCTRSFTGTKRPGATELLIKNY